MIEPTISVDGASVDDARLRAKSSPDGRDALENAALESDRLRAEIDGLNQINADKIATRQLRADYAKSVYRYLLGYSLAVAALLVLVGFRIGGFALPDSVLVVLAGSTAVSAIGLVGFVVNGLFKPG